jgi:hypothetical protein
MAGMLISGLILPNDQHGNNQKTPIQGPSYLAAEFSEGQRQRRDCTPAGGTLGPGNVVAYPSVGLIGVLTIMN